MLIHTFEFVYCELFVTRSDTCVRVLVMLVEFAAAPRRYSLIIPMSEELAPTVAKY